MNTTVINLYGGPGCGKSTTASGLFHFMKREGLSVELVQEYVKEWAWQGRTPTALDQPHFFGEQSQREARLYNKVKFVVTDSPLWLSAVYGDPSLKMADLVSAFTQLAVNTGVKHLHFILNRTKDYNASGRFQTETEAVQLDNKIIDVLRSNCIPTEFVSVPDYEKVDDILFKLREMGEIS